MTTLNMAKRVEPRLGALALRFLVVGLTLATAAIHGSLGGLLFLANAVGYATLAVAMIVPGPLGRVRWLVRLALLGFTAAEPPSHSGDRDDGDVASLDRIAEYRRDARPGADPLGQPPQEAPG